MFEKWNSKEKKTAAAVAGALVVASGATAGVTMANSDGSESVKTSAPVEQDAQSTTTTQAEVSAPLTTAPAETVVTVEAPVTTVELAPSGENELTPQSVEQIMAQLTNPEIGQVFQENILFTTLNLNENTIIYSAPDANSAQLAHQAGGATNAVLLNEKFACFNMTPDNPEQPGLTAGCVDIEQAGIDLDTIQKGSMTVEQILEDGRGYGDYNGELQVIAAFNSTANDVVEAPHGDVVTQNPDGSTNYGHPPVTPQQ